MKLVADSIGVDAGMIMVGCMSYLDTVDKREDGQKMDLGEVFDVPNGKYKIHWRIRKTWNGNIQGDSKIEVTSGKVFVCDPCYIIGNDNGKKSTWITWLETTDYGNAIESDKVFILDEMGGDGEYKVELTLIKE